MHDILSSINRMPDSELYVKVLGLNSEKEENNDQGLLEKDKRKRKSSRPSFTMQLMVQGNFPPSVNLQPPTIKRSAVKNIAPWKVILPQL